MRALERWVGEGPPPPTAEPFATDAAGMPLRDPDGIILGGVRTPWVDAPSQVYSGLGQEGLAFAMLFGRTLPLPLASMQERYPRGGVDFREQFTASLRRAVDAGFILGADSDEATGVGFALWPLWPFSF